MPTVTYAPEDCGCDCPAPPPVCDSFCCPDNDWTVGDGTFTLAGDCDIPCVDGTTVPMDGTPTELCTMDAGGATMHIAALAFLTRLPDYPQCLRYYLTVVTSCMYWLGGTPLGVSCCISEGDDTTQVFDLGCPPDCSADWNPSVTFDFFNSLGSCRCSVTLTIPFTAVPP